MAESDNIRRKKEKNILKERWKDEESYFFLSQCVVVFYRQYFFQNVSPQLLAHGQLNHLLLSAPQEQNRNP